MTKKIRAFGVLALVLVWAILAGFAWGIPSKETSDTERRPLAQFPELSVETLLSGKFMENFETYTLDQFPGRDVFRKVKAWLHYGVMGQKDNHGIYIEDGFAAQLEYPENTEAITHAIDRMNYIYETYLKDSDSKVSVAVIPDKGYYLAADNGYPSMDYPKIFRQVKESMPWASYVDLTDCLTVEDYYRTDTHWRQEALIPAAQKLSSALEITPPKADDFTKTLIEKPFYGVYYGQAALPMEPENMYILQSDLLKACRVYNYETQSYGSIYDLDRVDGKDMYEMFLSGSQSLLRIENPNAATDKELILFRDSFGSSIAPLLVQDYATVTLVDIRYLSSQLLGRYLEFNGQDVLFLYSTLVLNNGTSLK